MKLHAGFGLDRSVIGSQKIFLFELLDWSVVENRTNLIILNARHWLHDSWQMIVNTWKKWGATYWLNIGSIFIRLIRTEAISMIWFHYLEENRMKASVCLKYLIDVSIQFNIWEETNMLVSVFWRSNTVKYAWVYIFTHRQYSSHASISNLPVPWKTNYEKTCEKGFYLYDVADYIRDVWIVILIMQKKQVKRLAQQGMQIERRCWQWMWFGCRKSCH